MSDKPEMIKFTLSAGFSRDGHVLDPLMFYGGSYDHPVSVRLMVNPQVFDESAMDPMPLFVEQLCDGLKRELLRIYCGITEDQ